MGLYENCYGDYERDDSDFIDYDDANYMEAREREEIEEEEENV